MLRLDCDAMRNNPADLHDLDSLSHCCMSNAVQASQQDHTVAAADC